VSVKRQEEEKILSYTELTRMPPHQRVPAIPKQEKTLNREIHTATFHPGHNGDRENSKEHSLAIKLCCWHCAQQLPLYCSLMHTE
jgi:hypothetical protein